VTEMGFSLAPLLVLYLETWMAHELVILLGVLLVILKEHQLEQQLDLL